MHAAFLMKYQIFILLATLLLINSCNNPKQQEDPVEEQLKIINQKAIAHIDSTLRSMVESGQVAGVSSLIFEKNEEVYFNAFGFADKEAGIPMDRNTIVKIYSMTKPITGTALMTLHEKGAFQLDDPISTYAPEFTNMQVYTGVDDSGNMILEPANRPITIRDVTRHTGGFTYHTNLPVLGKLMNEVGSLAKENTLKQMGEKLASLPLLFHPGTQWEYGISVDVQAYLVEKISGQPFDQYEEKIYWILWV
jgi:CubicO group peptidase (beta-lactamase class C family)